MTPTFTVTCTETPFIIDMFEDNDLYDNVNPDANMWYGYINPNALPSRISNFDICGGCGAAGGHALDLQGIVYSSVPDGSGGFYGYFGAAAPINSGTSVGFDFTQYRFINFDIDTYIWDYPVSGTAKYTMKLLDNNGSMVEQDFSPQPTPVAYYPFQLNMNSFTLPAGATYTAAQVLSNVTELRWEYSASSSSNTDWSDCWIWLDNITLEK
jgi:hypothetical protein